MTSNFKDASAFPLLRPMYRCIGLSHRLLGMLPYCVMGGLAYSKRIGHLLAKHIDMFSPVSICRDG